MLLRTYSIESSGKRGGLLTTLLPVLGYATLIFMIVLYFLSCRIWHIHKENSISIMEYTGSHLYGELREVIVMNMFPDEIELYFDDNEAGIFLTKVNPYERSKLRVSSGNIIYATGENSAERISTIAIRDSINEYHMPPIRRQPMPRNSKVRYQLGAKEVTRRHPQLYP